MKRFQFCAIIILIFGCLLYASTAVHDDSKIGQKLQMFLSNENIRNSITRRSLLPNSAELHDTINVWVIFNSHCDQNEPREAMNVHTLARRIKHGQIHFENDAKVCRRFINEVLTLLQSLPHSAKLRQESRWLNAASYSISIEDVQAATKELVKLNFVQQVESVSRFVRDDEKFEPHNQVNSFEDITATQPFELQNQRIATETEEQRLEMAHRLGRSVSELLNYGSSFDQNNRTNIVAVHRNMNLTGAGVTVLVLDSGFNRNHLAFAGADILDAWDFVHNDSNVGDEAGESGQQTHGTAAWSNIGGKLPAKLYGGAYDASWLLAKTEDSGSETSVEEDYFVAAMEWGEARGADILSASLGYDGWYSWSDFDGATTIIARVAQSAINRGLLMVVANGNAGAKGIGTPADIPNILACGAIRRNDDSITSFSSLGPTFDGRIKPDVSAPGEAVIVANAALISGTSTMSGTSFATPITAGIAALVLQAHPDWTNLQIREAIVNTAVPRPGIAYPNIQDGWGFVNAIAAIDYVQLDGSTQCTSDRGTWSVLNGRCACKPGFYGTFCQNRDLTCRDYCLPYGLCGTGGNCFCTSTSPNRCTRNAITMNVPWTCSRELYNDGQVCNCNCGLFDPDCLPQTNGLLLPIIGCADGARSCINSAEHTAVCTFTTPIPSMIPSPVTPNPTPTPTNPPAPQQPPTIEITIPSVPQLVKSNKTVAAILGFFMTVLELLLR